MLSFLAILLMVKLKHLFSMPLTFVFKFKIIIA